VKTLYTHSALYQPLHSCENFNVRMWVKQKKKILIPTCCTNVETKRKLHIRQYHKREATSNS